MKYNHSQIGNMINNAIKHVSNYFGTITVAKVSEDVVQNAMKNGGSIEINVHS